MITPIILAGGGSSRFGTDKSLLKLGTKPLIYWVSSALTPFGKLIISISSEDKKSKYSSAVTYPHKFVLDEKPDLGALGGMLSAAESAEGEYIAVAPCDTPLITTKLYEILSDKAEGMEGAVPKINGYWEPLVAVYQKKPLIELLKANIESNTRRLNEICTALDIREVSEFELERYNINNRYFFNINTPEDLREIHKYIENND